MSILSEFESDDVVSVIFILALVGIGGVVTHDLTFGEGGVMDKLYPVNTIIKESKQ